mmetsp:Transcript_11946/g.19805  ORF Transcript_11946/g.19805 Transcript_11946/m.19805 type:complete len:216 (-) Transcript_11946:104-751(-)|eukprot:CAMPEP_0119013310 /NCGR_PEP_ID=MMETSP1176-20130426/8380_1 /TAXON_ID=265551 /ORGANISM="Synedropsis recta cf, Strain CCMP1620" /LENGTH=215 /DNA_ID=CAMNT_0006966397 /DNA_START=21 /DNA_END=668 /DNA_ORIENTATION=+
MARFLAILSILAVATAFTVQPNALRPTTKLSESFGFDFAEDSYENTPGEILGEANYKQWVNRIDENSFLNRQYNPLRRVRELGLLQTTVDAGLLSKLEKNGLDLVTIEKLLPVAEELGLLSVAANNQQLLLNLVAFFLIEGAPFLLPPLAGALEVGPPAFYLASASALGLDAFLLANHVELPFVGLSAGFYLGLLLVPVAGISAIVGTTLAGLKK